MPQSYSWAVTEHANNLSKQQSGETGSFRKEPAGPGGRAQRGPVYRVQSRWRRQVPARSQPEVAGGLEGLGDSGGGGASRPEEGTGELCSLAGLLLS